MTTAAGSQAIAGPRLLGSRITRRLLDRLARRAVTVGPRELLPVGMPAMTAAMRALQRLPGRK